MLLQKPPQAAALGRLTSKGRTMTIQRKGLKLALTLAAALGFSTTLLSGTAAAIHHSASIAVAADQARA
jgi:hypothetical protein